MAREKAKNPSGEVNFYPGCGKKVPETHWVISFIE